MYLLEKKLCIPLSIDIVFEKTINDKHYNDHENL